MRPKLCKIMIPDSDVVVAFQYHPCNIAQCIVKLPNAPRTQNRRLLVAFSRTPTLPGCLKRLSALPNFAMSSSYLVMQLKIGKPANYTDIATF